MEKILATVTRPWFALVCATMAGICLGIAVAGNGEYGWVLLLLSGVYFTGAVSILLVARSNGPG